MFICLACSIVILGVERWQLLSWNSHWHLFLLAALYMIIDTNSSDDKPLFLDNQSIQGLAAVENVPSPSTRCKNPCNEVWLQKIVKKLRKQFQGTKVRSDYLDNTACMICKVSITSFRPTFSRQVSHSQLDRKLEIPSTERRVLLRWLNYRQPQPSLMLNDMPVMNWRFKRNFLKTRCTKDWESVKASRPRPAREIWVLATVSKRPFPLDFDDLLFWNGIIPSVTDSKCWEQISPQPPSANRSPESTWGADNKGTNCWWLSCYTFSCILTTVKANLCTDVSLILNSSLCFAAVSDL